MPTTLTLTHDNACLTPLGHQRITEFLLLSDKDTEPGDHRFVTEVQVYEEGVPVRLEWAELVVRSTGRPYPSHVVYFPSQLDQPTNYMDSLFVF